MAGLPKDVCPDCSHIFDEGAIPHDKVGITEDNNENSINEGALVDEIVQKINEAIARDMKHLIEYCRWGGDYEGKEI